MHRYQGNVSFRQIAVHMISRCLAKCYRFFVPRKMRDPLRRYRLVYLSILLFAVFNIAFWAGFLSSRLSYEQRTTDLSDVHTLSEGQSKQENLQILRKRWEMNNRRKLDNLKFHKRRRKLKYKYYDGPNPTGSSGEERDGRQSRNEVNPSIEQMQGEITNARITNVPIYTEGKFLDKVSKESKTNAPVSIEDSLRNFDKENRIFINNDIREKNDEGTVSLPSQKPKVKVSPIEERQSINDKSRRESITEGDDEENVQIHEFKVINTQHEKQTVSKTIDKAKEERQEYSRTDDNAVGIKSAFTSYTTNPPQPASKDGKKEDEKSVKDETEDQKDESKNDEGKKSLITSHATDFRRPQSDDNERKENENPAADETEDDEDETDEEVSPLTSVRQKDEKVLSHEEMPHKTEQLQKNESLSDTKQVEDQDDIQRRNEVDRESQPDTGQNRTQHQSHTDKSECDDGSKSQSTVNHDHHETTVNEDTIRANYAYEDNQKEKNSKDRTKEKKGGHGNVHGQESNSMDNRKRENKDNEDETKESEDDDSENPQKADDVSKQMRDIDQRQRKHQNEITDNKDAGGEMQVKGKGEGKEEQSMSEEETRKLHAQYQQKLKQQEKPQQQLQQQQQQFHQQQQQLHQQQKLQQQQHLQQQQPFKQDQQQEQKQLHQQQQQPHQQKKQQQPFQQDQQQAQQQQQQQQLHQQKLQPHQQKEQQQPFQQDQQQAHQQQQQLHQQKQQPHQQKEQQQPFQQDQQQAHQQQQLQQLRQQKQQLLHQQKQQLLHRQQLQQQKQQKQQLQQKQVPQQIQQQQKQLQQQQPHQQLQPQQLQRQQQKQHEEGSDNKGSERQTETKKQQNGNQVKGQEESNDLKAGEPKGEKQSRNPSEKQEIEKEEDKRQTVKEKEQNREPSERQETVEEEEARKQSKEEQQNREPSERQETGEEEEARKQEKQEQQNRKLSKRQETVKEEEPRKQEKREQQKRLNQNPKVLIKQESAGDENTERNLQEEEQSRKRGRKTESLKRQENEKNAIQETGSNRGHSSESLKRREYEKNANQETGSNRGHSSESLKRREYEKNANQETGRKEESSLQHPLMPGATKKTGILKQLPLIDLEDLEDKKPKVLIVIFVLSSALRYDRRLAIRDTWWTKCKEPQAACMFVTDGYIDETLHDGLLKEKEAYNDILFLPVDEGLNFGMRLLFLMEWVQTKYNPEFFLRIDDDYFICIERLLHELPQRPRTNLVWGFWHCDLKTVVFIDESFILLSYDLVEKFLSWDEKTLLCHPFGDQQLGIWLNSVPNFKGFFDVRLHHDPPASKNSTIRNLNNICDRFLGLHGTYPEDMRRFWLKGNDGEKKVTKFLPLYPNACHHRPYFKWQDIKPIFRYKPELCNKNPRWENKREMWRGRQ